MKGLNELRKMSMRHVADIPEIRILNTLDIEIQTLYVIECFEVIELVELK